MLRIDDGADDDNDEGDNKLCIQVQASQSLEEHASASLKKSLKYEGCVISIA